ncbi:MAG: ThiF family adenylyltransferase [Phycisphaerae bacterium]
MPDDATAGAASTDPLMTRYGRQILFDRIGIDGQARLSAARVVLVGCGALGTVLADTLVRAGVGHVRICDRDFIERNNLQRQVLFDEDDIAAGRPKAEAAAARLARINPDVTVEARVVDVNPTNIEHLADRADALLDGTDNFETRFLINDYAVKTDVPWIYGAVIGASGLCMAILPHDTPCLRCVFEEAPPPEMNPTCDTAGVIGPAVHVVAGLQAVEAIKLLSGRRDDINRHLTSIDVWTGRVMQLNVQRAYDDGDCPCCRHARYDYLDGRIAGTTTTLCGRNAVQVGAGASRSVPVDFAAVAAKLAPVVTSPVRHNPLMLRAEVDGFEVALFPDGRAIIKGTDNPDRARVLYAKYFGA